MQFFGQYLVQENVIPEEALNAALNLMATRNQRIGALAVAEGILTQDQADQINQEQRFSDRPFGAIAVSQGVLTEPQLQALVQQQRQAKIRLGEALIYLEHLNAEQLVKHLRHFNDQEERFAIEHGQLPDGLRESRLAEFVIQLIPRVAMRVASVQIRPPKKYGDYSLNESYVAHASVVLQGTESLYVGLSADIAFAERVFRGIFHHPEAEAVDSDAIDDGLAELLKVIAHHAITDLEQEGHPCEQRNALRGVHPHTGNEFTLTTTIGSASLVLAVS